MKQPFDIAGSYNNQRYKSMDSERSVNLYEYVDPNDNNSRTLVPTSGLVDTELVFSGETTGSRLTYVFNNVIYQVFGASLYRIVNVAHGISATFLAKFNSDTGFIGVAANTFQILFVDGQDGWIWDTQTDIMTRITSTSFPALPIDCTYLDGYFVVAAGGTNTFQLSSFNQGLVWGTVTSTFTVDTTTDFFTIASGNQDFQTTVPIMFSVQAPSVIPTTVPAIDTTNTFYAIQDPNSSNNIRVATSVENARLGIYVDVTNIGTPPYSIILVGQVQQGSITSHPGTIVACRTLHRRLFLFSQYYTEVWENAGLGENLPFRRNNSLLMEVGTPAIGSISVDFDRMFFLSQDRGGLGSVMEVTGTASVPVSTHALDYQLAQYAAVTTNGIPNVNDARGLLIKENGIIFYRLNFTEADHTFVLNVSMSDSENLRWHEEEMLNGTRHVAQTGCYYDGKNYVASYIEPKFYLIDSTVSTNDEETIRRMRISKSVKDPTQARMRIDVFQLDLLQGNVALGIYSQEYIEAEDGDQLTTEHDEFLITENTVPYYLEQPYVLLSYSKDGGQTYGYSQRGLMGKLGERTYRTLWRKLGVTPRGQSFTVKIEFFFDIPFVVLGAMWAMEVLPE